MSFIKSWLEHLGKCLRRSGWASFLSIRKKSPEKLMDVCKAGITGGFYVFFGYLKNMSLAQEITSIHMHLTSFQMPVEIIAIPSTNLKLRGRGCTFQSQTKGLLWHSRIQNYFKIVQTMRKFIKPQIKGKWNIK